MFLVLVQCLEIKKTNMISHRADISKVVVLLRKFPGNLFRKTCLAISWLVLTPNKKSLKCTKQNSHDYRIKESIS